MRLNTGRNNELEYYIKTKEPLKLRSNNKKIIDLQIFEEILKMTDPEYSDKARIYLYILGKYNIMCQNEGCENIVKFDNEKNAFRQFCSVKCRNVNEQLRKQISDKWDDSKVKEKNRKTIETCNLKYGVNNPMQHKDVRQKSKETCLERYGVEYVSQSDQMKQKSKETCLEKYGVEHAWQSKEVRDKAIATTRLRTGVNNINQLNITNFEFWEDIDYIEKEFKFDGKILVTKMSQFFNCHSSTCFKRFKQLGIDYDINKGSVAESEISNYIESLNVQILKNDRTLIAPNELDIYIPSKAVAIEFNGLYWHSYGLNNTNTRQSDLSYNKKRHKIKTIECLEKNVQLFHIFENEWSNLKLQNIWKSQISNALKCNDITIGARKCKIEEISSKESNTFLENNHLQGACVASIKIALKYKDEIISVMTFGKSRYAKDVDYELIRFCSKLYTQVPGAASRLLKYFELNYKPKGLVSYANARWSTGHLYKTLGFIEAGYSQPNYFYYHTSKPDLLFSRVKFQKHKLPKLLKIFDIDKTEMQNMIENNYRAIFDAGNYKFIKNYF